MYPCKRGGALRNRAMARLFLATIAMAFAAGNATASPGVNVGAGVDDPINGEHVGVFTVSYLTNDRFPWEFGVGWFSPHDSPTTDQPAPGTYYLDVSRRLTWHHLFASAGLVYDTANDRVLSGHYQIQSALGLTYGPCTLSVRHMSNADTYGTNHGESFALFEYGF